ncbi:MAG TPA: hypothetical protein VHM91_22800 [Verrucomicrobiales bacterium]|nr:hypothetical protein [Verrucomicrobiales bacterium]
MKSFLQRYGIITVSLGVLFASGLAAGYQWGRHSAAVPAADLSSVPDSTRLSPAQWSENAAAALQKDLDLSQAQTDSVRRVLAEPSRRIFEEKHRGNLKIHLRLLEAHDILSASAGLSESQKTRLKVRREQLRLHILEKFHDLIGDKPDPILGAL